MTSWLYRDARENYKFVYDGITDEFLQATYAALETNLAALVKLTPKTGNRTFSFSTANQYVSGYFAEGRITNVSNVERAMPTLFTPTVEFSDFSFTIANNDKAYSHLFLPATSSYIPLHNASLDFSLGIPDKTTAYRTLFRGFVKFTDGVTFDKDTITIKASDALANKLSSLPPLETITPEAFPRCAKDSVGKMIPLNLGDFTSGFTATEIGLTQVKVNELTFNVKAYNVNGGGVIGYYVDYYYTDQSGGVFLFNTGGRANKTYYPDLIQDVYIKRSNVFMRCKFNALPRAVGGHWCVDVLSLYGRNAEDTQDVDVPYYYQDGDVAIVVTRFPIEGYMFDPVRDTSPLMQASELLIALARLDAGAISTKFYDYHYYLTQRYGSNVYASNDTITVVIPKREYDRDTLVGGAFAFQAPRGDSLYSTRKIVVFLQDMIGTMLKPREIALSQFLQTQNGDLIIQGTCTTAAQNIPADKLAQILVKVFNAVNYSASITQSPTNYVITARTQMPQKSVVANIVRLNLPDDISIVFSKGVQTLVLQGISPLLTRISINDSVKDKPIIDTISSLLKCVLANIYVDKNLQLNVCPLIYEDIANKSVTASIEKFEIIYDSIQFSSELFFTTARANYNYLGWQNSAANQTPFARNQLAIDRVGEVRKEIDLPYIYDDSAARFVVSRYVSYASAGLMVVKFDLPFRYLYLDIGDKLIVNIDTGSVVYEKIPLIIRKITVNSKLTTVSIEGWFFANYSLPGMSYPTKSKNLSNHDAEISFE